MTDQKLLIISFTRSDGVPVTIIKSWDGKRWRKEMTIRGGKAAGRTKK